MHWYVTILLNVQPGRKLYFESHISTIRSYPQLPNCKYYLNMAISISLLTYIPFVSLRLLPVNKDKILQSACQPLWNCMFSLTHTIKFLFLLIASPDCFFALLQYMSVHMFHISVKWTIRQWYLKYPGNHTKIKFQRLYIDI